MLEWFKCPDTQVIPVKECLSKCRMDERCLTLPILTLIAQEREWTGTASTTQLLNGTMYTFLKLTQPYTVDPDSMAFALLGTKHHQQLDEVAKALNLSSEIALTGDDRDIFDLLEHDADGTWTLTDYKTWGSYRVAKVLGIVETGKKPDPSGAVYQKSGKWGKAGSPKMVTVFQQMPQQADNMDTELQLNRYRVMVKDKFSVDITKLWVQITVRDGGLAVARSRGIERNTYMVPVKILDDDVVHTYFNRKNKDLVAALTTKRWTLPCDNHECWDGVRCESYCEVAIYCPKGILHQKEN